MKYPVQLLVAAVAFHASVSHAREVIELERAIRELPSQFVADISVAERDALLRSLRRDSSDTRLDLKHGFLHFYSDSSHDGVHATSMLYMRQFSRAGGGSVILTHMPKPFADGSAPRANQTFVLERRNGKWTDVTAELVPKGVDLTSHFRPQRVSGVVQVAPYIRAKRRDGRGDFWDFGPRVAELHWDGRTFQKHRPAKKTLSNE